MLLTAATGLLLSASPAAAGSGGQTRPRLLQEEGDVLEQTNDAAGMVQAAAAAAAPEKVVELGPGVEVELPQGFAEYLYKSANHMGPVLVRACHS